MTSAAAGSTVWWSPPVRTRGGLNPYQYVQVNLREQCSWVHREEKTAATEKAIRLVRSGIAKCRHSEPLEGLRIETVPKALVVGAGVAGLRAALALSDLGLSVFVVEKAPSIGGWTGKWGRMFPHNRRGSRIIGDLEKHVREAGHVTVFTGARLIQEEGSVGNFSVKLGLANGEIVTLNVGAIIVATGFDIYRPKTSEFGYGEEGVLLLPDFRELVDSAGGPLEYAGRQVKDIVYVYCVGSRQSSNDGNGNLYCSRYCCATAVHTALCAVERSPDLHQFHLFRDMRTYGKYELLYEKASHEGSVFVRFDEEAPPEVFPEGDKMIVKAADVLDAGEDIEIPADLVVLVTDMVPRKNDALIAALKIPTDGGGFFNEIHPKLRPVETAINGVFIAGASQGPKTLSESVASSLAAVAKGGALVMKGYVDLDPHVAVVDPDACTWCGKCAEACPYGAIEKVKEGDKEVARVIDALCKGGGPCVPACPEGALDLKGYTNGQIRSMIESMLKEAV
ncbi:MAG: FAD-dependent oxidoreductase [Acidobacteriota bacterium]